MKVFAGISLAVLGLVSSALPAAAQDVSAGTVPAAVVSSGSEATPPRGQATQMDLRGQFGGLFWGGGSGLILGGAVGARPFNNKKIEVVGDFSFLRFEGHNGLYIGADGLYHFTTNEPNFSPFAGAGLGILHLANHTEVRFQIAGGLELNKGGKYPFRPEVRFIFTEGDTATVLLVSINLARK